MRSYSASRLRIGVFVLLLAAAIFAASDGFAQDAGAGGAAPTAGGNTTPVKQPFNPFRLVLSNLDFVFFIIVGLSIAGMTLIIQGAIQNRASVLMPPATTEQIRQMISERKFRELIDFTETDPSFVSKALNPALKRAPSFPAMKEAMETAIGEQTAEQFRKIEYLNIIGNLGPLLGLLGTVLGMMEAFQAMNNAGGSANPADLAGGISKALAHTMLGLLLAVPCLAAFGVFRTIVDRLTIRGALIAEELLMMIKPPEQRPAVAAVPRPGVAPQPGAPAPTPATAPRKPPPTPLPATPTT